MLLTKTFLTVLVTTLLAGLVMLGPVGCRTPQSVEDVVAPKLSTLVSSTLVGQYSLAQVRSRFTGQLALAGAFARYGVSVYRLVYTTTNTDGKAIQASGALVIPDAPGALPLVSQQHGTISSDNLAPSYYNADSELYTFGSLFASTGYILAAPDYIGYGSSNTLPHPYEHRESLATASLDMLRASREFIAQKNVNWNNQLFITGYSEGGYATMALQKKLEEDYPTEFNLVASSCGSGAYDKPAFMQFAVNNPTSGIATYNGLYIWVLLTYDRLYGLNRPMSYYFKEPYASRIEQQRENARVDISLNQTFTDSFRKAVTDGTDAGFLRAVQDNDIHDWRPKVPTRLYHGDADDLVFYFNSVNTANAMKKRGASNVELVKIGGGNHVTSIPDYVLGTFSFFSSIQ